MSNNNKNNVNNNINILIKKSIQKKVSIKEEFSQIYNSNDNIPKIDNIEGNSSEKKLVVNKVENKEFKYFKLLNFILLTLIMISFVIYIIILFLQNKMILTAHCIFKSLFYNYYQRDKLLNLYSSIISLLFKFSNFWINDINSIEDYKKNIINSSLNYDTNYHKFYKYYVKHKNMIGEEYTEFLEERNFTKIQINYENKTFKSDYISQAQYVFRYGYNLGSFDNDNNIEYDSNMILFDNYLNNLDTETKSSFSVECFYLMVNYENEFKYYFHSFQIALENCFENFSTKKSNTYLFLEIFGIFIYLIFFTFVIIFLCSENKTIFSNVLNMFIDFTQDGDYSFKNQKDNFIIKMKIGDYITLTKNFNFINLKKYNTNIKNYNYKPEPKTPISKISTSKMKSSNILVNLNSKKNNNSIENAISLTGSNINLIKKNSTLKNFKIRNSISNDKKNNNNSTIENLKSILSNKEQIIEEEISLTASNVLIYMKNPGIKKIKYFLLLISFFLLIIIIYFFLKIENSLSYIHDIKTIFFDFGQLTYRYTLAFYYYNSLRVLLISKNNGRKDVFNDYSLKLDDIYKNNQKILNTRIQSFKETNDLYSILKIPWNDTSIKKKICGNNEKCFLILETHSESKLVTDGLLIALDAIFQKILNTFNDYIYAKNITNQEELTIKLIDEEFQLMESTLSFVINIVQELVYNGFFLDENNIKKVFQSKVNLFNLIAIIYCIIVGIVVMFGILQHISYNSKLIGKGTIRINNAFCYIKQKNLGNKVITVGSNSTILI